MKRTSTSTHQKKSVKKSNEYGGGPIDGVCGGGGAGARVGMQRDLMKPGLGPLYHSQVK